VREQIEVLASLQNVDRKLKERHQAKAVLLAEIRRRKDEMMAKRAEVELLRGEWVERDRLRQDKERVLHEESRKAVDKRMRMNRIRNIKELQALQREIDQIKQSNAQLEEELIAILEDLELRETALEEREKEIKRLDEESGGKQGEVEAQVAEIDREVQEATEVRKGLAGRLNGDLIKRYELIFSRRGGTAVVAVSEGICQGCYMNIPPQLWNEIIKSERLNLCPSCHRILYKPNLPNEKQV